MPLKIELAKDHKLTTKNDDPNILLLPVIDLAPSDDSNLPHISGFNISVSGTPEYLAQQIQSAYKTYENRKIQQPLKLERKRRLQVSDCHLERPLPADVNCTLSFSVDYFDSDESGNANLAASKNVKAQCHLYSSVEKAVSRPSPQTEEIPQTSVSQSAPVSPSPRKQNTQPPDNKTQNRYPGWFAIDFGTSGSTVTLYDPKKISDRTNLPKPQEERLRKLLAHWLNERDKDYSFNTIDSEWEDEWEKLLSDIKQYFNNLNFGQADTLGDQIFIGTKSTDLLEAIRRIEISLNGRKDWFQKATSKQLNQIYYEVSRIPPLDWQNLIAVELDRVRKEEEIPSELEIESLDPSLSDNNPSKVKVLMGNRVKQNKNKALANPQEISKIRGKFHHSPKRFLGQKRSIEVTLNDINGEKIPVQNLTQAAYAHLIELTDDFRNADSERFAGGKFYTGVITYPTIAPPKVRREIKQLVRDISIENVQMTYDEAVAVAIFYLLREFSGDLNIGIESFKTRCHRQGNKWSQNVLVLDIGGGTTDIALMSLILEELNPFNPEEDRGYGGRYYKLTPQLLGSSGHLQLGGELITLKIFLLLKAAIADCLLSAISEGIIDDNRLKNILSELNEDFIDGNKFKRGTLFACLDKGNTESDASYTDALNDAEKVLSTRFEKHPERLQTFYTLWEYAEEAKIQLGKKPDPKQTTEPTFVLTGQKISEMLGLTENELDKKPEPQEKTEPNTVPTESQTDEKNNTSSLINSFENLSVTLTRQQFERAVTPVIQQAIGIAKGLVENRLQDDKEQVDDKEQIDNKEQKEQVDWLILSGKTCNLDSVEHELYQQFNQFDHFLWNKERITFVPEYSKLATSIGACYAEKLRQLSFDLQGAKPILRKGANQLFLDVKNLLYFLPSSFERQGIGNVVEIFKAGDKLFLLDPQDSVVKIRSQWLGMQISSFIYRKDFEGMLSQLWGSYNLTPLANRLGKNEDELRGTIKVQFEVDQNLDFSLLLCRHGKPYYLISSNIPGIQIKLVKKSGTPSVAPTEKNKTPSVAPTEENKTPSVAPTEGNKTPSVAPTEENKTPSVAPTERNESVIFNGTKLLCDIAVGIAESATFSHTDAHNVLFEAEKDYSKEFKLFCDEDGNTQRGLISTLGEPPLSGKHTFHFHSSDTDHWEMIGELSHPKINTEYPYQYYVSLDESGVLRIHAGEVPYLRSDKEEDLLKEGYVFCTPLELEASKLEKKRDPFSGIH